MKSFYLRAQPLFNIEEMELNTINEFEALWETGTLPSWEKAVELDSDSSLFCIPCKKQFTKSTIFDSHLTGRKHLKAHNIMVFENLPEVPNDQAVLDANKEVYNSNAPLARLEFLAKRFAEGLSSVKDDTRSYVERKQTLTDKERLEDMHEEPIEVQHDSDEDDGAGEVDGKIYNPLKLPMGWDGKPIPFWLYKVHGLGVQYPCEICGGYVYMGRKAFDRHFQEWRHTHGLKCLGIQNSRLYQDIVLIKDAAACT